MGNIIFTKLLLCLFSLSEIHVIYSQVISLHTNKHHLMLSLMVLYLVYCCGPKHDGDMVDLINILGVRVMVDNYEREISLGNFSVETFLE